MSALVMLIVGGWAYFIGPAPAPVESPPAPVVESSPVENLPAGIEVVATMYSCEPHPRNPMYPCNTTRWGYDPATPGMACPIEWRERVFDVPGHGRLRCDDSGRYDFLDGLPHIDIRGGYAAAIRWGIQTTTIYLEE